MSIVTSTNMTATSRAAHSKTRNGCGQCKRRHVKCNLQAPTCAHCERRREKCDYEDLGLAVPASKSTPPVLCGQRLAGVSPDTTEPLFSDYQVLELYATGLRNTIERALSPTSSGAVIFLQAEGVASLNQELAGAAEKHLFLQRILSSISALQTGHRFKSRKGSPYVAAYEHQLAATTMFHQSVQAITEHNWVAVIAFSISTLVCHLDQMRRTAPASTLADVVESMQVLRSAAHLSREIRPWLLQSRIMATIQSRLAADVMIWDDRAAGAFARLHDTNQLGSTESENLICHDAIVKLQAWLRQVSCRPRTWLHMASWPGEVSPEFLSLLSERRPVALVIFLHWCAIMARGPKRWFLDGWAQAMAMPTVRCLGPQWAEATSWACAQLRISFNMDKRHNSRRCWEDEPDPESMGFVL